MKELQCVALLVLMLFRLGWTHDRPIVGILTEEVYHKTYPGYDSLITASYVKMVEQSGARVVPIFINKTEEYYRQLMGSINGVLFPGGGLYFTNVGGYADAAKVILDYAKEVNSAGDHFPILGVCLGCEVLFYHEVGSYDILPTCNATNISLPLRFKNQFHNSKLYCRAPKEIIDILSNLPVTFNYHRRCLTEDLLRHYHLDTKWHVLSTSIDKDGNEFVSSIESHKYPIAGVQFHPEKNAFEWNSLEDIPHSHKAILSARYFYDWLITEARKSNHCFSDLRAESTALIYNYKPTYVGNGTKMYEEVYLFKEK